MSRFLNKITGEEFVKDKLVGIEEIECVQLPEDGKDYIPSDEPPFYKLKPVDIEKLREDKLAEDAKNYQESLEGFKLIDEVPINIDPASLVKINGQVTSILVNKLSNGQPLSITWYDDNSIPHDYTEGEFINLAQIVSVTITKIETKHSLNVSALKDSSSVAEIEKINTDYKQLLER